MNPHFYALTFLCSSLLNVVSGIFLVFLSSQLKQLFETPAEKFSNVEGMGFIQIFLGLLSIVVMFAHHYKIL